MKILSELNSDILYENVCLSYTFVLFFLFLFDYR